MRYEKTVAVVGGDLRFAHLANTFIEKNGECQVYGMFLEKGVKLSPKVHKSNDLRHILPKCDIIIFPLPLLDSMGHVNTPQSDTVLMLQDCLNYISSESTVLAGMVSREAHTIAGERGIEFLDYFQREEFAVLNAVPTAEGAIEIAIHEMPTTLCGSTCVIVGFGRIAKVLSKLLTSFGAKVRIAARKQSDIAWARINGCEAVHISDLSENLRDVDCLFNTAPAVILGEEKLSKLGRQCLVIDLASKPGGVDFETAKLLGLKAIWALSLPGKVSPFSAGEIILSTIMNILGERGII